MSRSSERAAGRQDARGYRVVTSMRSGRWRLHALLTIVRGTRDIMAAGAPSARSDRLRASVLRLFMLRCLAPRHVGNQLFNFPRLGKRPIE